MLLISYFTIFAVIYKMIELYFANNKGIEIVADYSQKEKRVIRWMLY